MSKVKFRFFSALQEITQTNKVEIDVNGSVRDALEKTFEIFGNELRDRIFDEGTKTIRQYIIVSVNLKDIRNLDGLDTKINPGDEISIFPAAAGGTTKINNDFI